MWVDFTLICAISISNFDGLKTNRLTFLNAKYFFFNAYKNISQNNLTF